MNGIISATVEFIYSDCCRRKSRKQAPIAVICLDVIRKVDLRRAAFLDLCALHSNFHPSPWEWGARVENFQMSSLFVLLLKGSWPFSVSLAMHFEQDWV